mgnify:FL=1|tara:strand:- start:1390 stop:1833 length:444 start_codon:yes stop_codon:yes gene_type:complete
MAFHGSTTGLTGVNDVVSTSRVHTTTDRHLTGSFVDHITSGNHVVPSGYRGLILAFGFCGGLEELNLGQVAFRIRLTGSSSSNPTEAKGHQGYQDFDGGDITDFQAFDVGNGTYQVRLQARESLGAVVINNRQQKDLLFSTCLTYRA